MIVLEEGRDGYVCRIVLEEGRDGYVCMIVLEEDEMVMYV